MDKNTTLFKIGKTYHRYSSPKRHYTCLFDNGEIVLFKTTGCGEEGSQSWHRGLSGERNFLNELKPVPKTIEGWINVYPHGDTSQIWSTREKADGYASSSMRIACIPVKFTEGEGI